MKAERVPLTSIATMPSTIGRMDSPYPRPRLAPAPIHRTSVYSGEDPLEIGITAVECERRLRAVPRVAGFGGPFTIKEFGAVTGAGRTVLHKARDRGAIEMVRVGERGWLIPISSAVNYIASMHLRSAR